MVVVVVVVVVVVPPAVIVEDNATRETPLALTAVANALYIGACPTIASMVAVTEEAPSEEATSSLDSVGTPPFLETLIDTL